MHSTRTYMSAPNQGPYLAQPVSCPTRHRPSAPSQGPHSQPGRCTVPEPVATYMSTYVQSRMRVIQSLTLIYICKRAALGTELAERAGPPCMACAKCMFTHSRTRVHTHQCHTRIRKGAVLGTVRTKPFSNIRMLTSGKSDVPVHRMYRMLTSEVTEYM